jgi:hypothetical protein
MRCCCQQVCELCLGQYPLCFASPCRPCMFTVHRAVCAEHGSILVLATCGEQWRIAGGGLQMYVQCTASEG